MSIYKPKDDLFFELFEQQAKLSYEATMLLKELINDFDKISETADKLLELIKRGDKLRFDLTQALANAFITPFEREDIHHLSILLDKILGRIISAVMRMKLYKVELSGNFKEYTGQLIDVMSSATGELIEGVRLLRKLEPASVFVHMIKKLEQEGDMIQREAIAALFNGSVSAIDIIKWKEIYEQLEKVIDFCEDISLHIDNMIIKHS
jgi:hypothetical protein